MPPHAVLGQEDVRPRPCGKVGSPDVWGFQPVSDTARGGQRLQPKTRVVLKHGPTRIVKVSPGREKPHADRPDPACDTLPCWPPRRAHRGAHGGVRRTGEGPKAVGDSGPRSSQRDRHLGLSAGAGGCSLPRKSSLWVSPWLPLTTPSPSLGSHVPYEETDYDIPPAENDLFPLPA